MGKNKSLKRKLIETVLLLITLLITIIVVYTIIDSNVDREYISTDSQSEIGNTYKSRFNQLVSDVEERNLTGIPTLDDLGVSYGAKIEINKGTGDFSNIKSNWQTSSKTYTWYNAWGGSYRPINWSPSSNQYTFAYSKSIHNKSTLYARSGVVKLYDRYSFVALGTYWSEKFGLNKDTGATYRVYMDNGKTYDIITFDVAATGDYNSVNATNGKSLGHSYGKGDKTNVVITEFDLLSLKHNYPILPSTGNNHPEMRYEELMTLKDDSSHTDVTGGTLNIIPEFEGNVVALQIIHDAKVIEILQQAQEEVKKYKGN